MFCHFGEALVRLYRSRGVSRGALRRQLGLSAAELAEIECTASLPPGQVVAAAAAALGITEDELLLAAGVLPRWLEHALQRQPAEVLGLLQGNLGSEAQPASEAHPATSPLPPVAFETPLGCLYHGNCLPLMKSLPSDTVDLIFADPPFNLNKDYGELVDDRRAEAAYFDWSCAWLTEVVRLLKPGGALFLYNIPRWNVHLASWLSGRLEFRHWIVVDIKFSLPIPGRLYPSHYSLLYYTKGRRPRTFVPPRLPIETCRHCGGELRDYGGYKDRMHPRGVNITDVWTDISPVRHARFKRRRANQLPLKLLDRVLDIASVDGDVVLDPFGGSGTTYVAAELKGRRWIGSEIADCQTILKRFQDLNHEREILNEVRSNINILFTPRSLALRQRNGHDTSRYRIGGETVAAAELRTCNPGLFDEP